MRTGISSTLLSVTIPVDDGSRPSVVYDIVGKLTGNVRMVTTGSIETPVKDEGYLGKFLGSHPWVWNVFCTRRRENNSHRKGLRRLHGVERRSSVIQVKTD